MSELVAATAAVPQPFGEEPFKTVHRCSYRELAEFFRGSCPDNSVLLNLARQEWGRNGNQTIYFGPETEELSHTHTLLSWLVTDYFWPFGTWELYYEGYSAVGKADKGADVAS